MDQNRRKILQGLSALGISSGLAACKSTGAALPPATAAAPTPPAQPFRPQQDNQQIRRVPPLKDNYAFLVGAAVYSQQLASGRPEIDPLQRHFNSLTSEYEMKAGFISPTEGTFNFTGADQTVDFAEANKMAVRGHALLWHESTPDYFLTGSNSQIKAKLENYIGTVVDRYKGRIYCWDVVNEVVADNWAAARTPYRDSIWYQAVGGPEYIDWAFNAAREADPDAKLFINDYSTEDPQKRGRLVTVVNDLLARNIPLDGVGHQFHTNLDAALPEFENAINAIDGLNANLENHITELDVSFYNDPGSCYNNNVGCDIDAGPNPPRSSFDIQARIYKHIFDISRARPSVTSLSMWGVDDGQSWLNGNPVTRVNHPLLFDRNMQPKRALYMISDPAL